MRFEDTYLPVILSIIAILFLIFWQPVAASISTYQANEFSQYCADNPLCLKTNFSGTHADISCPQSEQIVDKVYVHAGDGQTVYELPHKGFILGIATNSATVDIDTHPHELSWVGIICSDPIEPSPEVSPSPTPLLTPSPEVSPSPSSQATPSPIPSFSATPTNSPEPSIEKQMEVLIEEVKKENGGILPDKGAYK